MWLNPYGYLPGELYGMMPFFGVMASCYTVVGLVWLVMCCIHWDDLTTVQSWVSVVLCLGERSARDAAFVFVVISDEETQSSVLVARLLDCHSTCQEAGSLPLARRPWTALSSFSSVPLVALPVVTPIPGLLENVLKFADYLSWNASGSRGSGPLAASLVFGVTKRALSRVLVIMVGHHGGCVWGTAR